MISSAANSTGGETSKIRLQVTNRPAMNHDSFSSSIDVVQAYNQDSGSRPILGLPAFLSQRQGHQSPVRIPEQLPPLRKVPPKNHLHQTDNVAIHKIEHFKGKSFEQYTIQQTSAGKKAHSADYVCFINTREEDSTQPAKRKRRKMDSVVTPKRRPAGPRVKSMDELLLEESVRRNRRRSNVPDLMITGGNAPGYQCKWEKLQHLPDIKPMIPNQPSKKLSFPQEHKTDNSSLSYSSPSPHPSQDDDSLFTRDRVHEILVSEGFLDPQLQNPEHDRHLTNTPTIYPSTTSSHSSSQVHKILIDRQILNSRSQTITRDHRVRSTILPAAVSSVASNPNPDTSPNKSFAILHTKKRTLGHVQDPTIPTANRDF